MKTFEELVSSSWAGHDFKAGEIVYCFLEDENDVKAAVYWKWSSRVPGFKHENTDIVTFNLSWAGKGEIGDRLLDEDVFEIKTQYIFRNKEDAFSKIKPAPSSGSKLGN